MRINYVDTDTLTNWRTRWRAKRIIKNLNKRLGYKPSTRKPCWLHQYDMTFGHLLHYCHRYTTDGITQRTCSNCHACSYMLKDHPPYKFCPRCGKRMHDA